jgi:GT2 family glycosyltransferase
MGAPNPTLSIVIPTYRGAARLRRLLESMFRIGIRSEPDVEVLVVDDGSEQPAQQETIDIVHTFRYGLELCPRRGYVHAVRSGVNHTRGDIILLLDDDVIVPHDLLSTLSGLMQALPNVGVLSWRSQGANPGQSKEEWAGFLQPATQLAGYCMAFTRLVWNFLDGFDPRFQFYCADSDFALRATLAGFPSYRVWWPLVPHEEHGSVKDSVELSQTISQVAQRDLTAFLAKWGKDGAQMEAEALRRLTDGR